MKRYVLTLYLVLFSLVLSTGCGTSQAPTAIPTREELTINVLYPTETTEVEMGQTLKSIVQVLDKQGRPVENAQVNLSFQDPDGRLITTVPATFGGGDVYRTDALTIPHRAVDGDWTLSVETASATRHGTAATKFHVKNSTSETLLYKYGFWVDAPTLRGIVPTLGKEQGDAQNGVIIWGGIIPAQHIFPENWVEIHWREGNFKLDTAERVREFMLDELGDLGFTPLRELGPFQKVKFKEWEAWHGKARGQLTRYDMEWMIFYSPEADKTYAISTMVVQMPTDPDPHDTLRNSFEVHPEVRAQGTAPKPLPRLLPPPKPVSPELGASFLGTGQPIVLRWEPVKELAEDEYYLVKVDYNYVETNIKLKYTTRGTQFTLPESLYSQPNCGIFNWRVTLMKQTGLDENGQPEGEPLSFPSLYRYVVWRYPFGEEVPFKPHCPNEQF